MVSRIVVINDTLRATGGAEALAIASAELFRAQGHAVTFFTGEAGNADAFRAKGIEVVEAGGTNINDAGRASAFVNGLYRPASRHALDDWIARNDTPGTIYHVHAWSKILSPSIFGALRRVAARTLLHAHDFFLLCPNGGFTDFQRSTNCDRVALSPGCLATNCDKRSYTQKLWRVGRHAIRHGLFDITSLPSNHILLHDGMIPLFLRAGVREDRLHVIPNPVDFPRAERIEAEQNRQVIFLGRLDPEKGAQDAAAACREAGAPLSIIGDGPLRGRIAAEYPEVDLAGWCAPSEVTHRLAAARLLVVPSRWRETFGLAAVEALRLGVPVIMSDRALIGTRIAGLGAGMVVKTGDIATFAATLRALMTEDSTVRAMSERAIDAARALTLATEDWRDAMLAKYETVLAQAEATTH